MKFSKINLGFLVDANYELGTGNVIRCLNLAKFLENNPIFDKIYFFSQDYALTNNIIKEFNFLLKVTPTQIQEKINFIINQTDELSVNILIIDIPNIDENIIKNICKPKLIIILLDTSNENLIDLVDIMINILPSIKLNKELRKKVFQGLNFWILKQELVDREIRYKVNNEVKSILISFGTTDPVNLTKRVCVALEKEFKNFNFKLIIGPGFKKKDFFKEFSEKNINFKYIENPSDIYEIMEDNDIALSAGGGTLIELIYIGIPTIILPNSSENYKLGLILSQKKMAFLVGDETNFNKNQLILTLKRLIEDYELREEIKSNCRTEFRENGAAKIEKIIIESLKKIKTN